MTFTSNFLFSARRAARVSKSTGLFFKKSLEVGPPSPSLEDTRDSFEVPRSFVLVYQAEAEGLDSFPEAAADRRLPCVPLSYFSSLLVGCVSDPLAKARSCLTPPARLASLLGPSFFLFSLRAPWSPPSALNFVLAALAFLRKESSRIEHTVPPQFFSRLIFRVSFPSSCHPCILGVSP